MSQRGPDVGVIVQGLRADIERLCRELLPQGRRDGAEWCCGSIDGEAGQSCRVHIGAGARTGVWCDFATGETGDALDLVAACLYRGDKKRAYRWASYWLGLTDATPEEVERRKAEADTARTRQAIEAADREEKFRRAAQRIFIGAEQALRDTPVARYLAGRGIDLAVLGRQPRSLRYAAELYHGKTASKWPGMVAMISGPSGEFLGVHRTFLQVHPDGSVTKAPLGRDAKMSLGRYRDQGGYVRLWRGGSGRPWNTPAAGEWVAVTEGLEDALCVALAKPDQRVACAISLSSLPNTRWPPGIAGVLIVRDNVVGADAEAATQRLREDHVIEKAAAAFRAQGLGVKVAAPPPGFKDVNDWLRGTGCA